MPTGPRRPRFHVMVLLSGFLLGGFLNAFLLRFLPESPTKAFFTYSVHPGFGPVPIDLLVIAFTVGPVALHVSILSLLGVMVAYLIAKSLF